MGREFTRGGVNPHFSTYLPPPPPAAAEISVTFRLHVFFGALKLLKPFKKTKPLNPLHTSPPPLKPLNPLHTSPPLNP